MIAASVVALGLAVAAAVRAPLAGGCVGRRDFRAVPRTCARQRYREEELARMKLNFYGFDPSYHVARYHFVYKMPKARTPGYLARHRAP